MTTLLSRDADAELEREDEAARTALLSEREQIFGRFESGLFGRLKPFVRPHRTLLLAAIVAILCFVAAQLAIPLLIRATVDSITGKAGSYPLAWVFAAFALLVLLNSLANYWSDMTASRLAQRIIFDLRRAMFAHLQLVSQGAMDGSHVGRIMSRLQGDVNAVQEFFETSVTAVGDFVLLLGIVIALFLLEWRLALLTLLLAPMLLAVRALWLPRARAAFTGARDSSSIVNGALAENINGVRVVQGMRREKLNLEDFDRKATANRDAQLRAAWSAQVLVPAVDIATGLAMVIVTLGGGWLLWQGRIDIGVVVAFIFYVQRFFDPVRTLSQQYTMAQRAATSARRIFEVIDVPLEIMEKPGAPALRGDPPTVEFRDVRFGYQRGRPILDGFNLTVHAGETLAIVGPTGSGKSSVAALACRLYDVWDGAVLVGGQDLRDVSRQSIGRKLLMVLQEPFLFTGTIADNIRFASNATRAQIVAAAKAVQADAFITALPQGYDTPLDQRGQNLSVGQRQLISFARALVADPAILILDEATASIDSVAEARIQQALRVLLKGRTAILIAHRLATVRDADRIIVLQDGAILEQGSPIELLASGGLYAGLYRHNFESFDEAG
ncbi:ABC transporter ATP-binding protein/permease [Sandaracinobacter sp. RS1-74]|uniref:ABC transporter ATP-binding protein n=1 Tax=Sandaracinobacteroides sayramensis TaxID=2913411 RepID=UPI001EDA5605|nr:ABC transporter ATP-binding protein [Sandaracinobacteroides sayramensis]MCG2842437.1 ABC transporter ATP-binding protein/permease [Sandaracinobacteroides sayramensis]